MFMSCFLCELSVFSSLILCLILDINPVDVYIVFVCLERANVHLHVSLGEQILALSYDFYHLNFLFFSYRAVAYKLCT